MPESPQQPWEAGVGEPYELRGSLAPSSADLWARWMEHASDLAENNRPPLQAPLRGMERSVVRKKNEVVFIGKLGQGWRVKQRVWGKAGVVLQACNPSTLETELEDHRSGPTWAT